MNEPTGKRVAVYLRVSTLDQSCDLQRNDLDEYVQLRGWTLTGTYEDKASGTTAQRQQLKLLLRDARARKFDIILCWKLDRFFRSLRDLCNTLHELHEIGVEFVSFKDQIDLTTAAGRLLMQLLGCFAEFEAALIQERVRAGLIAAKARGKRLGRPRKDDDCERIKQLRQHGLTLQQIADKTGLSIGKVRSTIGIQKTLPKTSYR